MGKGRCSQFFSQMWHYEEQQQYPFDFQQDMWGRDLVSEILSN